MSRQPRVDFVEFFFGRDGYPIAVPHREELVSLCVILNEMNHPNLSRGLVEDLKKRLQENGTLKLLSQADDHSVEISPGFTRSTRLCHSKYGEPAVVFERTFGTSEVLEIMSYWSEVSSSKKSESS